MLINDIINDIIYKKRKKKTKAHTHTHFIKKSIKVLFIISFMLFNNK